MKIGEKIKSKRIELGWSQQKLADLMGYTSKSTITKIEKGVSDVGQRNIEKFAEVLGVSIAYLMDWQDEKEFSINSKPTTTEDSELSELISLLNDATPDQKKMVLQLAKTFLQSE